MKISNRIAKMNTKMIFSCISDSLVFFIDDLDSINKDDLEKLGYYAASDSVEVIDYKENCIDDISQMYGVISLGHVGFLNLQDFYTNYKL